MAFHTHHFDVAFPLESGRVLPELDLAYHSFGKLNAAGTNVIWVCHAFTANSNVEDWWPGSVGPGRTLDPEHQFIICVNIPGSCYGSTGPLSLNPETGTPYFHDFPRFTIRDVVRSFILLADALGIQSIEAILGGSLGGQQALEWAIMEPNRIRNLILTATNASHSAWGIAFNESQRLAIRADHTWKENQPEAGKEGMKVARSIGLLSYRNYQTYVQSQSDHIDAELPSEWKVAGYQKYQGEKLAQRFNAFSYYVLSQTMDTHHVGRGRNGISSALALVRARTLVIGITSDYLFPVVEQKEIASGIAGAEYVEIDSTYGHDGFLVEVESINQIMKEFLQKGKNHPDPEEVSVQEKPR